MNWVWRYSARFKLKELSGRSEVSAMDTNAIELRLPGIGRHNLI